MQRVETSDAAPAAALAGAVYARPWRLAIAALRVGSRVGLLYVMLLVVYGGALDLTPLTLFRAVAVLAALPGLAAWLLEQAFAAYLVRDGATLVVGARGRRLEIPLDAVAAAEPWRMPLPRPGLSLRLRSGRRIAVALDDPARLLALLGRDDDRPVVRWAAARARAASERWWAPVARYPLFALLPGAILFRTHQWIAYGGTFGQYYLLGLRTYLVTFAVYWATVTLYLVLWANLWRLVVEAVTLIGAHAAPAASAPLRRVVERAHGLLYYGGALVLLAVRLLP
jgi:apolipoprotein N-acyltransferase